MQIFPSTRVVARQVVAWTSPPLAFCCKNSGKQRETANRFAVISAVKLAEAQDFRGGRDVDRCKLLAKTAKNSEGTRAALA